jgi:hypothetical protein
MAVARNVKWWLAPIAVISAFVLTSSLRVPDAVVRLADALTHRHDEPAPARGAPRVRGQLELHLVEDGTSFMTALARALHDDAAAAAADVRPELEQWSTGGGATRTDAYLTGPSREALERAVAATGIAPLVGTHLAYERTGARWRSYLVRDAVIIDGAVITDADVMIGEEDEGPFVIVSLDAKGRERMAEATGANVGKKLAIMVDGVVMSAPVITGAITAGRIQVTPSPGTEDARKEECYALVIAFRAGAVAPREVTAETVEASTLLVARVACALLAGLLVLMGAFVVERMTSAKT